MRAALVWAGLLAATAQPAHATCTPSAHLRGTDRDLVRAVAELLEGHGVRVNIAAEMDEEWGCVAHEIDVRGAPGDIEVVATDPRGEATSRRVRTPETAAAWLESWLTSAEGRDRPSDTAWWSVSPRLELGGGNDTSTSLGLGITVSRALTAALEAGLTLRVQTGWMDAALGGVVEPRARGNADAVLGLAVRQELEELTLLWGLGVGARALFGRFNNAVPLAEPSVTVLVPLTLHVAGEVRGSVQVLVPDGPLEVEEWINGRVAFGLRWTLP